MKYLLALALFCHASFAAFTPSNRKIDVEHYLIRLKLDPAKDPVDFEAEATVRVKVKESLSSFTLDRKDLQILKSEMVRPAGKVQVDQGNPDLITLKFQRRLPAGTVSVISLTYKGKIRSANEGFFKVKDPDVSSRGNLFFTHFEPLNARAFFPSNDEPYDKATSEIVTTLPAEYEAVSNGKRMPDRKLPGAWKEVHWKMEKPHSTYLVSLAIGKFEKLAIKKNGVEVSAYSSKEKIGQMKYLIDSTAAILAYLESYTGVKYPWSKYATVGIPTFIWGGMENTSSTHMKEERMYLVDANAEADKTNMVNLFAHELAHQWFGDYATMKWWDDIWLNESFANYLGTKATAAYFKDARPEIRSVLSTWDGYFRQEDGPRSHPIVDQELSNPEEAFDSISYVKGENVLRMLSFYIGEDKFKKGLQRYLNKHALGNGTYLDFFGAMEAVSGESLSKFRDSWLLRRGYPVVTYDGSWDDKRSMYRLNLSQRPNHPEDSFTFHFKLPVVFHRKTTPAYSKAVTITMGQADQAHEFSLLAAPEWVSVNTGSTVLARVKQKTPDESTLALQATSDPDLLSRIRASYELASPLFAGEKLSSVAESSLINTLRNDGSAHVRTATLEILNRVPSRWLPGSIGATLLALAQEDVLPRTVASEWSGREKRLWTTELTGSLGKVQERAVTTLLERPLLDPAIPIDTLERAAKALARQGEQRGFEVLKASLKVQSPRGYRYTTTLKSALGSFENTKAIEEMRSLEVHLSPDILSRVAYGIRDNETLKNSSEWSKFLKEIVLENTQLGDEPKSRLLHSVEESKSSAVRDMLREISEKSTSERLKELSQKMLQKNFG